MRFGCSKIFLQFPSSSKPILFFQFFGIRHSNGCGCLNKFGLLWLYLMNIFYFRFVSQCLVVLFILWSPESKCLCTFPYFWNMHKQSGSGQEYILILSLLISKSLYIASASILETSSLLSFATSTSSLFPTLYYVYKYFFPHHSFLQVLGVIFIKFGTNLFIMQGACQCHCFIPRWRFYWFSRVDTFMSQHQS